ncbi:MAG: DNA polymerase Y family protein [Candidatus Omnitrophota bacterium]
MDAFFASIEQVVNPKFKGRPLIVGSRDRKFHTVVCAASYEAKALGIDSGMSTQEALKICPYAEFVAADSTRYVYTSRKIFELLQGFSPEVEYASIDEFVLNPGGLELIFGPPEVMAKKIKERIRQEFSLTCSIGIASTRILAKLASKLDKPDGLFIIERPGLLEVLKDTPVEKLCGIGPALKLGLNNLGILSCLDLFRTPQKVLTERFGKVGLWMYEAVRLHDKDYPVEAAEGPKTLPKSVGHSYTLPQPISQKTAVFAWVRMLCEMVSERLRRQNLEAKTVYLCLSGNHSRISRQNTFPTATNDGQEIYARCQQLLTTNNFSPCQTRFVAVITSKLNSCQRPFLINELNRREALAAAVDRINGRFGEWTVFPAALTRLR